MLRKIVAGPKVRTVQNGYDLDLSYITTRVIAMAFPAEGFQKLYRNSIDDVSQFLKEKYQDNYMLFNLSGRKYDYEKFNKKVKQYDWEDHQAPTLFTVFRIIQQMYIYLKQNQENVVVVHCNHGKGRTGTIIVCLLLFCNFFDNPKDALKYYAKRRFQKQGYGVTQPCQIRYINYFNQLLMEKNIKIRAYTITKIQFKGKFKIQDCYCIVKNVRTKNIIIKTDPFRNGILDVKERNLLMGDVFLQFRIPGVLGIGERQFARLNLNTIFMPQNLTISLGVQNISLDNFQNKFKGMISQDFKIQISFREYCNCNLTESHELNVCPCIQQIRSQRKQWEGMYKFVISYQPPSKQQSVKLLFGQDCNTQTQSQQLKQKQQDNARIFQGRNKPSTF